MSYREEGTLPTWLIICIFVFVVLVVAYEVRTELACTRKGGIALRTPSNMIQCVQGNIVIPVRQ